MGGCEYSQMTTTEPARMLRSAHSNTLKSTPPSFAASQRRPREAFVTSNAHSI
jgi:hypothetical protein